MEKYRVRPHQQDIHLTIRRRAIEAASALIEPGSLRKILRRWFSSVAHVYNKMDFIPPTVAQRVISFFVSSKIWLRHTMLHCSSFQLRLPSP